MWWQTPSLPSSKSNGKQRCRFLRRYLSYEEQSIPRKLVRLRSPRVGNHESHRRRRALTLKTLQWQLLSGIRADAHRPRKRTSRSQLPNFSENFRSPSTSMRRARAAIFRVVFWWTGRQRLGHKKTRRLWTYCGLLFYSSSAGPSPNQSVPVLRNEVPAGPATRRGAPLRTRLRVDVRSSRVRPSSRAGAWLD